MSGTAVPPGNCVTHGYHGRAYCPRCSTSALPSPPLGQAPTAAQDRGLWLSSKVGDWIWRELNAGRSVAAVTRELAERVKEMEARRVTV